MCRLAYAVLLVGFCVGIAQSGEPPVWTLTNPTGREYVNELVRLKIELPEDFGPAKWRVLEDGRPVPAQPEQIDGETFVWVIANLGKADKRHYSVEHRATEKSHPRVALRREGGFFVLDNGLTAVRVPAVHPVPVGKEAGGKLDVVPPPVVAVRLPDGKWVGEGHWHADRPLKSFDAKIVGDGTLFAKLRLEYRFEGTAGLDAVPAFYRAEITLPPDRRHFILEEAFEMPRGSYWEFDATKGWKPRSALCIPHGGGAGQGVETKGPDGKPYVFPPVTLDVGQTRMGDTLLNLIPRWSQAFDDGWFFMTHDQHSGVGAIACRAGKWLRPHDGMIEIKVKPSGDYAGLRCPTRRGKRHWYLIVGPQETWADKSKCAEYVIRHSIEMLDKLHQEYLLDWPGLTPPLGQDGKPVATPEEYASGAGRFGRRSRPFFGWGSVAGGTIAGDDHPITALIRAQVYLDPDTFGNYWLYFSPENPNFATHWWSPAFTEAAKCKDHPRFKDLAKLVEMKLREDYYHSITVPGGAGQECPGYMSVGSWTHRAKFCKEHFGFDATEWPQFKQAGRFHLHVGQPLPDGTRACHPGGDTHPPGPDVAEIHKWFGVEEDPATFKTEELPGFGVVFRNRPCTPRETYFAFKSGPNRGHYHGDQLSFHYCANARPLAVDHHCSYAPRAGQEHMHNRVAFHTDALPWANMDGYERLIAFKTSAQVDAAIGQVESERLRITTQFPPEKWDTELPQVRFDTPLKYRRTVVMLKGAEQDCFVIRDQHAGPDVKATYCLHVLGDRCEQKGNCFEFDGMRLYVVKPAAFDVARHDWEHDYGGKEATKGLRLTAKPGDGEFVTVIVPKPVRRCDVATFVLKGAFPDKVRDEGTKRTSIRLVDLTVSVAWKDGKLANPDVYVKETEARKDRFVFLGTVASVDGDTGLLRLQSEGVRGRFKKDRVKLDYELRFDRKENAYAGTYSGPIATEPAIEDGPRKGELTGTLRRDISPPTAVYDDASAPPPVTALDGGVRVGSTEVHFAGQLDQEDHARYVTVKQDGKVLLSLTGQDIDMDRPQGEIGLFVPDAGYPFGEIPEWLLRQRARRPAWYTDLWPLTRPAAPAGSGAEAALQRQRKGS